MWRKNTKIGGTHVQAVFKVFSIPILDFFTWFFQWELPSYPAWWAGPRRCSTSAWRWGACISTHRPGKVGWHDQQVFSHFDWVEVIDANILIVESGFLHLCFTGFLEILFFNWVSTVKRKRLKSEGCWYFFKWSAHQGL